MYLAVIENGEICKLILIPPRDVGRVPIHFCDILSSSEDLPKGYLKHSLLKSGTITDYWKKGGYINGSHLLPHRSLEVSRVTLIPQKCECS